MDLEGLVAEARERRPQPMPAHERAVAAAMAVAYLVCAGVVGAIVAPDDRPLHLGTVVALVLLAALTMRAQFEIGSGVASPAALAMVPMLFLAPLHLVPLLMPLAQVISRIPDFVTKRAHVDRWLYSLADSWPILGSYVDSGGARRGWGLAASRSSRARSDPARRVGSARQPSGRRKPRATLAAA